MEFKITQVSGSYHVVRANGKKYILDNVSMSSKLYFLGHKAQNVEAILFESDDKDNLFNLKKSQLGTTAVVLMVQPFLKILYNFLENNLKASGIVDNLFQKVLLFILSLIIGYFIYLGVFKYEDKRVKKKLVNRKCMKLVLKTDNQRVYGLGPIFVMFTLFCLGFYLFYDEITLLILSGLFSFAIFTFSYRILPIGVNYNLNHLDFEKIEEN
ncbi:MULTISPECIES: DUF443 domain-containing protein [Streptococcus]|uniref:hypothetical protein n=1 Tax=Streptococcus TaxID=1301 RepID=UPI000881D7D7|nr:MULTISPECIES: hypothetical protein [Streptococcus]MCR5492920.1 hypothetical protein [Streptococcus sp.]SDI70808.1 tandem five-transmembrane protein [Streptococcus equinus]SEP73795.1 tandem five-transmembrane protein [Streptococcus equinus]